MKKQLDFIIPSDIKEITEELARKIIDNHTEEKENNEDYVGLFYYEADNVYIAIDNTTNDCWVEEFTTIEKCIGYLCGDNSCLDFTTVEEFLGYAFDYLQGYKELPYESEERQSGEERTDLEVYKIILDKESFVETYDILEQEAEYHEIDVDSILDNLHEIKERISYIELDYTPEMERQDYMHNEFEEDTEEFEILRNQLTIQAIEKGFVGYHKNYFEDNNLVDERLDKVKEHFEKEIQKTYMELLR